MFQPALASMLIESADGTKLGGIVKSQDGRILIGGLQRLET